MKNALELKNDLLKAFDSVNAGTMSNSKGTTLATIAGKIIGITSLEIKRQRQLGTVEAIPFLDNK